MMIKADSITTPPHAELGLWRPPVSRCETTYTKLPYAAAFLSANKRFIGYSGEYADILPAARTDHHQGV